MNAAPQALELQAIRAVLATVPDPEVPVLTLDDLGIIRDVQVQDGDIIITLTLIYMGCLATHAIRKMVSDALVAAGYPAPRLKEQLSPPWTTDWISAEAREKLRRYGIAPPSGERGTDKPRACPHCGSDDTRLVSHFGSTACKALYRCQNCGEPFEYFKCH